MSATNWNHDEFLAAYKNELPYLKQVKGLLKEILRDVIHGLDDPKLVRARAEKPRIKEPDSLARKAWQRRWRSDQALWLADDLIGDRVVCNNIEDVYRFRELLEEKLPATEVKVQDYILKPGDAGYRALHLNFRLEMIFDRSTLILNKKVGCEVQIRSLLQDVWAKLSHADIYKGNDLPADLRQRMTDLSDVLSSTDQIASRVRKRVAQIRTPDDGGSVESRLIRCYADVFGESPPDYVIQEASDVASQMNEEQLERLPSLLRNPSFRTRVDLISLKAFGLRASVRKRFTTGVRAIAHSEDAALSHLQGIVDEEVRELDQVSRREILSDMPGSLAEFVEKIRRDPESIVPFAQAFSATESCSVCEELLVDSDALEDSLADYYELDAAPSVGEAVTHSGLQIPDFDRPHLCMYHGEQFRKD